MFYLHHPLVQFKPPVDRAKLRAEIARLKRRPNLGESEDGFLNVAERVVNRARMVADGILPPDPDATMTLMGCVEHLDKIGRHRGAAIIHFPGKFAKRIWSIEKRPARSDWVAAA